jgi:hypothetical protein
MTKEEVARLAQELRGFGVCEREWCVMSDGVFFPAQQSAGAYAKNHNLKSRTG